MVAFGGSLTPDQLCKTPEQPCEAKKKRGINEKQPMFEGKRKGLPSKGL